MHACRSLGLMLSDSDDRNAIGEGEREALHTGDGQRRRHEWGRRLVTYVCRREIKRVSEGQRKGGTTYRCCAAVAKGGRVTMSESEKRGERERTWKMGFSPLGGKDRVGVVNRCRFTFVYLLWNDAVLTFKIWVKYNDLPWGFPSRHKIPLTF